MDRLTSSIESTASSIVYKSQKTLTNEYVLGVLVVLAVAYVGSLAPKLPQNVVDAMDNIVVKGVMFFLIALGVTRNVVVSIIVALVVLAIILATQVYLKDKSSASTTEHLNPSNRLENGPQNNVKPFSNPAPVMVNDKDELIEEQPLGQDWVNTQATFPEGWSNDWDEYEQPAQYEMKVSDSSSHNDGQGLLGQYVSAAMNGQSVENFGPLKKVLSN
jgi:hypothetical protein